MIAAQARSPAASEALAYAPAVAQAVCASAMAEAWVLWTMPASPTTGAGLQTLALQMRSCSDPVAPLSPGKAAVPAEREVGQNTPGRVTTASLAGCWHLPWPSNPLVVMPTCLPVLPVPGVAGSAALGAPGQLDQAL